MEYSIFRIQKKEIAVVKKEFKTSIRLRDGDKEKIDELLLFEQAKRRNPRFSFTDYVREMIDSHESCKAKEQ